MLKEQGVSDNTKKIRKLKHSSIIREQVAIMLDIRKKYTRVDKKMIDRMIDSKCNWLFIHYTNLFNKLKKDQLNLNILDTFISTLAEIEEGTIDQHEGSVKVGQALKELYIDSALKQEKQREARIAKKNKKQRKPASKLTWYQYKMMK